MLGHFISAAALSFTPAPDVPEAHTQNAVIFPADGERVLWKCVTEAVDKPFEGHEQTSMHPIRQAQNITSYGKSSMMGIGDSSYVRGVEAYYDAFEKTVLFVHSSTAISASKGPVDLLSSVMMTFNFDAGVVKYVAPDLTTPEQRLRAKGTDAALALFMRQTLAEVSASYAKCALDHKPFF